MKEIKAKELKEIPKELLFLLEKHYEYEEGESFENCEEIFDCVLDSMGCIEDPKKNGEWLIGKSDVLSIGEFKVVAQYKQYIKEHNCICDKEFDCLLCYC